MAAFQGKCGAVAEWSKALAWKVSIRQNRIEGSNPSRSATFRLVFNLSLLSTATLAPGALLASPPIEAQPHALTGAQHGEALPELLAER